MHVLVTNDDGLESEGLWALAEAAARVGEVTVVAPAHDHSGTSTSLGLRRPNPTRPVETRGRYAAAREAYVIEGTPATCTLIACCRLAQRPFDLVLSGINHGANVASDIWLSGTIGAARIAWLLGIPAIAVSLDHDRRARGDTQHWGPSADIAVAAGRALAERRRPALLNLNAPNVPFAELAGLAPTFPSTRTRLSCDLMDIDPADYTIRIAPWATDVSEDHSDLWALDRDLASLSLISTEEVGAEPLDLAALCERISGELGLARPMTKTASPPV